MAMESPWKVLSREKTKPDVLSFLKIFLIIGQSTEDRTLALPETDLVSIPVTDMIPQYHHRVLSQEELLNIAGYNPNLLKFLFSLGNTIKIMLTFVTLTYKVTLPHLPQRCPKSFMTTLREMKTYRMNRNRS